MFKQESASEIADAVKTKKKSPEDVANEWIKEYQKHGKRLNSHTWFEESWILDQEVSRVNELLKTVGPENLPLAGVPVLIKDNIAVSGIPMTCSSKILKNFVPDYDATVITRLKRAGAMIFGKANMDEFAMGSSGEHSCFGPALNPVDETRVPGGSSGGSAVAVSAGMVPLALGSDTGGSVRQPAGFCGIVGYKPGYGCLSRSGLTAFGSSLDQIGPMSRTVRDVALFLEVASGHDPADPTSDPSVNLKGLVSSLKDSPEAIKKKKIGVIKEFFGEGVDAEVAQKVEEAIKDLERFGATVETISLKSVTYAIATYYMIAMAEASANLARFDGVRYGVRPESDGKSVADVYRSSRKEGLGKEVSKRIMLGTFILSAGYADRYYLKAVKAREMITREFSEAFKSFDLLLGPTSPTVAFAKGSRIGDAIKMYQSDLCTIPANLFGGCGVSLPCGFTTEGLPVGLQLMTSQGQDRVLTEVAHAYQCGTDWHKQISPGGQ